VASAYKPFIERFDRITDISKAQLYHTHLTPHPASEALSDHVSPVTEILLAFFPTDYSDADQKKFEDDLKKLVAAVEKNADTYTASAGGWVEEEILIPDTTDKAKAYAVFIGWQSVEAHQTFREHQSFKDNIHYVRQAKDLRHLRVVHYSGTLVNKGGGGVADISGDAAPSVQGEILNPQESQNKPPKTRADGTTTKNNDDLKGAANALHKPATGS
jgi:heme-degrading monooxygenase HmoA